MGLSLTEKLLDKSQEAFCLAIEMYNKPTIKYRVEAFALFMCNAWELMLKAYIINTMGAEKIYYKNNPGRTISLENCVELVFTNDKSPMRRNLEKIIKLRNTSTHFVTEEYEMVYVPLFQACLFNFTEKIFEFHNVDMTKIVPQNFLTLAVSMAALDESIIRAKYPEEIATKLIDTANEINELSQQSNNAFSIKIEHLHYMTKDKSKATSFVAIDNSLDAKVRIIKDVRNPNNTHNFPAKKCCAEIKRRLDKSGIELKYNGEPTTFNMSHFTLFCNYYGIKDNERFCYVYTIHNCPTYGYSVHAIEFIVEEIKKDPDNIVKVMKESIGKHKK